jgi:hypothetical protein
MNCCPVIWRHVILTVKNTRGQNQKIRTHYSPLCNPQISLELALSRIMCLIVFGGFFLITEF